MWPLFSDRLALMAVTRPKDLLGLLRAEPAWVHRWQNAQSPYLDRSPTAELDTILPVMSGGRRGSSSPRPPDPREQLQAAIGAEGLEPTSRITSEAGVHPFTFFDRPHGHNIGARHDKLG